MSLVPFYTPRLKIRNVSRKDVRILGVLTLKPSEHKDIYVAMGEFNEITEDTILKALERPTGDLYREVVEKRTIEITDIFLVSWRYGLISPSNIISTNSFVPGNLLSAVSDDTFAWVGAVVNATHPLVITGDTISIPKADSLNDGYLSKEDWLTFSAGSGSTAPKKDQKIWEYQDFTAPVVGPLTISAFENGTELVFNASYIVDSSAVIVLFSDNSKPPTTTVSIPGRWLPSNRVVVSSHIGTTVALSGTPHASLPCRVFFLVSVPADTSLPKNYIEAPKFVTDTSLATNDDIYVNQEGDETIYGIKTFEDNVIVNANLGINTTPTTELDVVGNIKTDGFRLTTTPTDGYFLKSNATGVAAWSAAPQVLSAPPGTPFAGQAYVDSNDYELYVYDASRSKWLSAKTISAGAGRNSDVATNIYLYTYDGIATSATPIVLPVNTTLIGIVANGAKVQTWTAEVRIANALVSGASLTVSAAMYAVDFAKNVNFQANDKIQIFMNGTEISRPKVDLYFARRK